jgi:hypothetical protein
MNLFKGVHRHGSASGVRMMSLSLRARLGGIWKAQAVSWGEGAGERTQAPAQGFSGQFGNAYLI